LLILDRVAVQKLRGVKLAQPAPFTAARVVRPAEFKLTRPGAILTRGSAPQPTPWPPRVTARPAGRSTFFTSTVLATPLRAGPKKVPAISERDKTAFVHAKYVGMTVKAQPLKPALVAVSPINRPSPEKEKETVAQTHSLDGVVVLAYVCRRLPKSPNPDPTLQW